MLSQLIGCGVAFFDAIARMLALHSMCAGLRLATKRAKERLADSRWLRVWTEQAWSRSGLPWSIAVTVAAKSRRASHSTRPSVPLAAEPFDLHLPGFVLLALPLDALLQGFDLLGVPPLFRLVLRGQLVSSFPGVRTSVRRGNGLATVIPVAVNTKALYWSTDF